MTIQHTTGCCACATEHYPCLGSLCPNVQPFDVIVCDECGEETDVYEYGGEELCVDCILNALPVSDAVYCAHCGDADRIRWFCGEQLCAACIEDKLREAGCYAEL